MSGWRDSNSRPPAPKAGALTGLRYAPKGIFLKSAAKLSNVVQICNFNCVLFCYFVGLNMVFEYMELII